MSRSPMFTTLGDTASGAVTIRAFRRQRDFQTAFRRQTDVFNKVRQEKGFFHGMADNKVCQMQLYEVFAVTGLSLEHPTETSTSMPWTDGSKNARTALVLPWRKIGSFFSLPYL
jgi:hypothetical protein